MTPAGAEVVARADLFVCPRDVKTLWLWFYDYGGKEESIMVVILRLWG